MSVTVTKLYSFFDSINPAVWVSILGFVDISWFRFFFIIDLPHDLKLNRFVPLLLGNLLSTEEYGNTDPKAKQKCMQYVSLCVQEHDNFIQKKNGRAVCVGGRGHVFQSRWRPNVPRRIRISACFFLLGTFDWSPRISNLSCRHNYSTRRVKWNGIIMDIMNFM